MPRKKVVHIVEAMLGGIRQHVLDIIENLDNSEYDIFLIYSDRRADKAFFDEKVELEKRCTLILCNEMQRELGTHDLTAYRVLVNHLKEIKPDIVHCHSSKAGIVGRMAAKKCGIHTIVYTPNAYAFETPDISILKKSIYVFAEKYLSHYATTMTINVSKGEMALARKYKLDKEEKFTLIYNGIPDIELPSKEESKRELGLKSDIHYVGVTARCARQKDPMTFLTIAEKVVNDRDDVEFIYIGDGEMMEQMQKYVTEHVLQKKVHLLGFRSDASRIVGALDVYLSTALYEGLPYSMIEAMRAGVPIIATDTVGNNELVAEGENGRLFPVGDSEVGARLVLEQIEHRVIKPKAVRGSYQKDYALSEMIKRITVFYDYGHGVSSVYNCYGYGGKQ